MAYVCPYCGKEELSSRKLEVKICLDCNKIVGCNDILEFLRKIGIQEEVVEKVKLDLLLRCL